MLSASLCYSRVLHGVPPTKQIRVTQVADGLPQHERSMSQTNGRANSSSKTFCIDSDR